MAVTVLNQPTTPNATKTKLVYTISGSNVNQPQYQYVTDIYVSSSNNLLTRLYTYPNLTGNGIVDVARVLDDNLEYDNYWQITGSIAPQESVKTFDIRFGEAYGTSISSSVTIFTGSSANYLEVFPGIVDPNEGSFNFDIEWFTSPTGQDGTLTLTNSPSNKRNSTGTEYYSKEDILYFDSSSYCTITQSTGSVAGINVFEEDESGQVVTGIAAYTFSLLPGNFNTFGVGPQNLLEAVPAIGTFITGSTYPYIRIATSGDGLGTFIYRLNKGNKSCNKFTNFAFINNYGFWDYYNIYNPTRKVTDVERNIYDQNYVDYSSNTSIYSYEKRGQTQYNTGYTDIFEITTDYVDGPISTWLTELFDSPDVYIQENGNFIPIVITNTSYEWNINENRQKLFQYTIQYQYANKRQDR